MSNGELGGSRDPWAGIELGPGSLMGAVDPAILAIEDAEGDVKGARARFTEAVLAEQAKVESEEENLASLQQGLAELLQGRVVGRPIDFEGGTALGVVNLSNPEAPYTLPESEGEKLAGSAGTIMEVEVGTFNGEPLERADAIVLLVEIDADKAGRLQYAGMEGYRYAAIADQARYTIHKAPQKGEQ